MKKTSQKQLISRQNSIRKWYILLDKNIFLSFIILLLFIFFLQQTKEQWRKSNQRALEADDHGDYNVWLPSSTIALLTNTFAVRNFQFRSFFDYYCDDKKISLCSCSSFTIMIFIAKIRIRWMKVVPIVFFFLKKYFDLKISWMMEIIN